MDAIIMFSNYLHDFAAGLLLAAAAVIYILVRHLGDNPTPQMLGYFRKLYRGMNRLVIISLTWIILGGGGAHLVL